MKKLIDMVTPEKAIEAIQEKIDEIELIKYYDQFYPWQKATIGTLKRVVPNNDTIIKHLSEIDSTTPYGGDYKESAKRDSKQLLLSLIKDIERFGIEVAKEFNKDREVIKIDVNQSNHQNQTTQVTFNTNTIFEIVKGELRNSELEELKEILNSNLDEKQKKKNFIEKIKSFGSDVASNILANIMTNPDVYNQLGGLF